MTITELGKYVDDFRTNVSSKDINMPVSTADLGIAWTAGLAADSDIVMANVHPFFAGVTPEQAPGWTWSFWTGMDTYSTGTNTTGGNYPKQIIAETGWPSEGGNNCGTGEKCPTPTEGSVASTENLNTFLDGWVCESLKNGTTYFYFEAFDEPWKVKFNDPEVCRA